MNLSKTRQFFVLATNPIADLDEILLSAFRCGGGIGWSPALGVMSICLSLVSMLSSCEKKEKPVDDHQYTSLCGTKVSPKSMRW